MQDTIEFKTVSFDKWEQIPPPAPSKPKDRFEEVLLSVKDGNIVEIEVTEEKDLKGMRMGIARRARNLGFLVEFRNLGTALYIKRSEKPLEEKPKQSETENTEEKTTGK